MPTHPQPRSLVHRDPALDGLRGVAILLVFLFHYGGGLRAHNPGLRALGYLTQAGWIGVDLFFALSGFLITGLLAADLFPARSPTAELALPRRTRRILRNFYARRALRILPLYFAALLACGAAALLTRAATLPQLKPLLIYAVFLQNLPPLLNTALHTPPPLPVFHLWSLAVEEQFYLLWPLALLAARTQRGALRVSLGTFVASCLFRTLVFGPHLFAWATANTFATVLPTRAGALALGSALSLVYRPSAGSVPETPSSGLMAKATPSAQTALLLTAILAVLTLLVTAIRTHTLLLNGRMGFLITLPAADVLSAATVALALDAKLLRALLSTRPLVFLGRISYGFYVLHILLEPLYDSMGAQLTHSTAGFPYQSARLVLALLFTTLAAWLSFHLLERPFLRLKGNFPRNTPFGA